MLRAYGACWLSLLSAYGARAPRLSRLLVGNLREPLEICAAPRTLCQVATFRCHVLETLSAPTKYHKD